MCSLVVCGTLLAEAYGATKGRYGGPVLIVILLLCVFGWAKEKMFGRKTP